MSKYQVIVGNIGMVYDGNNPVEASRTYGEYKSQSESGVGRAGCEDVTLLENGEPKYEHIGVYTRTYKIISCGNIRSSDGEGWELNDAHYTGEEVELPVEGLTVTHLIKALKDCGRFYKHVGKHMVYIDEEDYGYTLTLRAKRDGQFLYQFQPKDQDGGS
jgi:hypothetical protein